MMVSSAAKIGLISLICCLVGCAAFALISSIRRPLLELLLAVLFSPVLLLFGWFWYPAVFLVVTLMWAGYTKSIASNAYQKQVFWVGSTTLGMVLLLFPGLTQTV